MAFKMKAGSEGPMRKNFGKDYSPLNIKREVYRAKSSDGKQDTKSVVYRDKHGQVIKSKIKQEGGGWGRNVTKSKKGNKYWTDKSKGFEREGGSTTYHRDKDKY